MIKWPRISRTVNTASVGEFPSRISAANAIAKSPYLWLSGCFCPGRNIFNSFPSLPTKFLKRDWKLLKVNFQEIKDELVVGSPFFFFTKTDLNLEQILVKEWRVFSVCSDDFEQEVEFIYLFILINSLFILRKIKYTMK